MPATKPELHALCTRAAPEAQLYTSVVTDGPVVTLTGPAVRAVPNPKHQGTVCLEVFELSLQMLVSGPAEAMRIRNLFATYGSALSASPVAECASPGQRHTGMHMDIIRSTLGPDFVQY